LAIASQLMPSSSSTNAFARLVTRVSAFPSRISAIKSAGYSMIRASFVGIALINGSIDRRGHVIGYVHNRKRGDENI
jgi:hypothetical protein